MACSTGQWWHARYCCAIYERHRLTSTEPGSWCSCRHRSLNVPHIPAVNARRIHAQQQAANSGSAPHCQRPKGPGIEEVVRAKRGLQAHSGGLRQVCGSRSRPQHSCATRRGMACAAAPNFSTVVRPKHRCRTSGSTPHLDGIADVGREPAQKVTTTTAPCSQHMRRLGTSIVWLPTAPAARLPACMCCPAPLAAPSCLTRR